MSSMRFSTDTQNARDEAVTAAAKALTAGDLAVIPTDTVYGLAADAFKPEAVAALLAAKGRGRQMPPPVLVDSTATLRALATEVPEYAHRLVEKFWPGPLTIVANQQPSLVWDLGDTKGTVAIRMPDHQVCLKILGRTGPLAVSSANTTGAPAATSADQAEQMLGSSVSVIVDSGESPGGKASTIVDVTMAVPRVLRWGALSPKKLNKVLAEFKLSVSKDPEE
jgi:L-threonylcarbamoyladenylate synthase